MISKEKATEMFFQYYGEHPEKSKYTIDFIDDLDTDYWYCLVSDEHGACFNETFPVIEKSTGNFIQLDVPVPA